MKQEWNSRVYSNNYLFYPDNISFLHSASKKLGNVNDREERRKANTEKMN